MTHKTIRDLIDAVSLEHLGLRYAEFIWGGWKSGLLLKVNDLNHPFQGAPVVGKQVTLVSGDVKTLTAMDRLRINEVTDDCLEALGVLEAAKLCRVAGKDREDIYHPQYVGTFAKLVELNYAFLLDNYVPAVSIMAWIGDSWATDETTVEECSTLCKELLIGRKAEEARSLNLAVRQSWLARVVATNTVKGRRDFKLACKLSSDVYALDKYVTVPVLQEFARDLDNNAFNN